MARSVHSFSNLAYSHGGGAGWLNPCGTAARSALARHDSHYTDGHAGGAMVPREGAMECDRSERHTVGKSRIISDGIYAVITWHTYASTSLRPRAFVEVRDTQPAPSNTYHTHRGIYGHWWIDGQPQEDDNMSTRARQHLGERGQNLVEYTLILLLVVLAVIGGLVLLGPAIGSVFSSVRPIL
jgi:Flp pilus assembly pilin Flp